MFWRSSVNLQAGLYNYNLNLSRAHIFMCCFCDACTPLADLYIYIFMYNMLISYKVKLSVLIHNYGSFGYLFTCLFIRLNTCDLIFNEQLLITTFLPIS